MFASDGIDYPEGGWKAHLMVFGSFMGLVSCFGLVNSLGAIETYIEEHQLKNLTSTSVAWLFSIFLLVYNATCVISGTYFDRNGARAPLIIGTILSCAGLFAMANCTEYYQFIPAFGILAGMGNGWTISPLVSVISHYFNRKRGFYSSISSCGGSLGGAIFPIMLRSLFNRVGFTWAIRIFSFIILFCYVIAILFAREGLPLKELQGSKWKKIRTYMLCLDIKAFKDTKFLFLTAGCTFAEISILVTSTFFGSYVRAQGQTSNSSYLLLTVINAAAIPGRWLGGYASDKVGRFNVIIVILFLSGICYFVILIPFSHHLAALYVFGVVWGFLSGSVISIIPVCCGQISRTEDFGTRYSTMYFVLAFGTLAALPIGGVIIDYGSSTRYNYFLIYCALFSIAIAVCYTITRTLCVGKTILVKF